MAEYNSTHTGNQVDNFNDRISALEATIASLNTNLTNNYVLESSFNTTINGINSTINGMNATMETFATKTQVNNMSMVPSNSYVEIPRSITSKPTSWTNFMSSYTAPTNGYLNVVFEGSSNTPAFQVTVTGDLQYRGNGNGSRNIGLLVPVRKGQVMSGSCIYCYPNRIRFYKAQII